MKSARRIILTAMAVCAALTMPAWSAAQEKQVQRHEYHHYKLVDIGTFGGPNSSNAWASIGSKTMNARGTVLGEANTSAADPYCLVTFPPSPDCFLSHAFEWRDGVLTDLRGLPGDANGTYAYNINSHGWISGNSGNGLIDPLTGNPQMDAVLWKDGNITDLGTLGGSGSATSAINERGQIVGAALNPIPDPFSWGFPATYCGSSPCIGESYGALLLGSLTQMHAVLWQDGGIKDLGTLGGPDSLASQINERGQIAGDSYVNSTPNAATGVPTVDGFFIGEDGKMVDLGNLGGTVSWVTGLNNRGQVIGGMTLAGDTGWHPFLWDHGILTDLGTLGFDCGLANALNDAGEIVGVACTPTVFLPVLWRDGVLINLGTVNGDPCGESYGINAQGQVVGESGYCGNPGPNHAWLWEDGGPSIDLNTLIPPHSGIRLGHAVSINDRGEISGDAYLANGDVHAFVLVPCDENHAGVENCDYSLVEARAAAPAVSTPVAKPVSPAPGSNQSPVELLRKFRDRLAHPNRGF